MYQINFKEPIHVHFMGIGGISMSGLAQILLDEGFTVSGSDSKQSALTEHLASLGAVISYGQRAGNITDDIDLVVYTAAISADNPEYEEACNRGIPMMTRADLLGQIMRNYKLPIAVSGTHGKTTTTSMISEVLLADNDDPTLSIGGILKSIGGNIRVGKSDYFVTEACEYTNSFLSFFPRISIILNIEEDHLDFFKDINDIRHSFHKFAQILPEDGYLIINGGINNLQEITGDLPCNVITFGKDPSCDYSYTDVTFDEFGRGSYTLLKKGTPAVKVSLGVVGEHNILNSLSVLALMDILGIDSNVVLKSLADFHGTDRRFEYKGTIGGVTILDDYAHHPTEIAATLTTAEHYPHRELWCIFQPHTYSRTKSLFSEFASALSKAQHLILADIYAARETDTLGVSSEQLAGAVRELGCDAVYLPDFSSIEDYVLAHCKEGDLLITMGAGDVVNIGEELLQK